VSSEHRHALLALPEYVHQHSRVLIEVPIRILSIIVVALIIRAILHRMINRAVRPIHVGDVPRILRPFKERVEGSGLLESTGLLSERRTARAATIGSVLRSGVSFTILVIAFLLVLSEVGIDLAPFIAGTSIVGVALGFGAQNIVKDFLSGMFMMLEDQYGVGDVIDFEKAAGTVEAVGLRTTQLRDVNGTVWYVRNGEVVRVGNRSQGYAQVVLDVPIEAAADIEAASAAMLAVAQQLRAEEAWTDAFLGEPEVQGVERLTREETVIRLVARVRPVEQWRVAREMRRRIRERLDRLNIDADLPPEPAP
jgi:moderate conductance mechanosensitive channel